MATAWPQAAFYNSETLGSNDAFQVTLPDLYVGAGIAPEQAVAIARSVFRRFIERRTHRTRHRRKACPAG